MTVSINDKLRKYKSLFSTTLSTGIGTGTGDTITPASVSGLPTDTPITLTFDRVDSGGSATPTKLERIRGIVSGGNFISYVRGKDGTTEQAHSAGAVIEMIWNADDLNDMVDWGVVEHNQDGTHKAATVTTLKATAAEVATGTDDTKIVTPKALADATVGKLGAAWTAFTPSWTNLTVGTGGAARNTGAYCQIGKLIVFRVEVTIGDSGFSVGNPPSLALPVVINAPLTKLVTIGQCTYISPTSVVWYGNIDGYGSLRTFTMSTYPTLANVSATAPFTWAAGSKILVYGFYEAA